MILDYKDSVRIDHGRSTIGGFYRLTHLPTGFSKECEFDLKTSGTDVLSKLFTELESELREAELTWYLTDDPCWVHVNSWDALAKVSMTKLLRNDYGFGLAVAKGFTDELLENGRVAIPVSSVEIGRKLVVELNMVGAFAEIDEIDA